MTELPIHVLTFEETLARMREPLAELEAVMDELTPETQNFVRAMREALDRYDAEGGDE